MYLAKNSVCELLDTEKLGGAGLFEAFFYSAFH